jgi:Ca2+-binding RTX toxin-like protein
MSGGDGNDSYNVDNIIDLVYESFDDALGGTADRINSSVSYSLLPGTGGSQGYGIENLYLTGTASINATGNDKNNFIQGNSGNNVLYGKAGNDTLVGGKGRDTLIDGAGEDRFTYSDFSESLLASFDILPGYASVDRIDAPSSVLATTLTASAGTARSLSPAAISAVLTPSAFAANRARAFTVAGQSGTFIALNNGIAGFNSATDSIIHLEGFNISLTNPVVII